MNVIGGAMNADQEFDYVLELPASHASTLRNKLMLTGVPERAIRVTWPTRAQSSRSDPGHQAKYGQPSRARPVTRFLPNAIKLGTYSEGLYNVTIRRRPSPEDHETVCISLSSQAAAEEAAPAVTRDDRPQSANQSQSADGGGGGGGHSCDDGPVTIPRCNCDDNECENYRMRLCEYFANNGTNYTNSCGAPECVHKQVFDALSLTGYACTAKIRHPRTTNTCRSAHTANADHGPQSIECCKVDVVNKDPAEVKEAPAAVKKAPAEVKKAPAELKKAPAELKKAPAEVKKAPAEVKKVPAEVKKTPAEVKKAPAKVKKAPETSKNSTNDPMTLKAKLNPRR